MKKALVSLFTLGALGAGFIISAAPSFAGQYTRSGALREMCQAGRQYRSDVMRGEATHNQAMYEIRSYAQFLSHQSPASVDALINAGTDGLWLDRCH